eukprot:5527607-Alexandrium_andersonii.AAC.1
MRWNAGTCNDLCPKFTTLVAGDTRRECKYTRCGVHHHPVWDCQRRLARAAAEGEPAPGRREPAPEAEGTGGASASTAGAPGVVGDAPVDVAMASPAPDVGDTSPEKSEPRRWKEVSDDGDPGADFGEAAERPPGQRLAAAGSRRARCFSHAPVVDDAP